MLAVRTWISVATVAAVLIAPAIASAASTRVAALQVALRAHGVYAGAVDGLSGPATTAGVRRIQRRGGLAVADGRDVGLAHAFAPRNHHMPRPFDVAVRLARHHQDRKLARAPVESRIETQK